MRLRLTDTHLHLTDPPFISDIPAILDDYRARGVSGLIVPSYNAESCQTALKLRDQYPEIAIALGLHPLFDVADLASITPAVFNSSPVAIGEIGLDNREALTDIKKQEKTLRTQLEWAAELKRPVILHCVRAHQELIAVLRDYKGVTGIVHRISCSWELACQYLDLGYVFGFGPDVLNPKAKLARILVKNLPPGTIVLETDSPYTGGINSSVSGAGELLEVLRTVAEIRTLDREECAEEIERTVRRIFGFDEP
jgi:TatD DNase family protein